MTGARIIEINGQQIEPPAGAIAYKFADAIDGARWIYDADDAGQLYRENAPMTFVGREDA